MSNPLAGMADAQVEHLIVALDSLMEGDLAVTMLVACGPRAVPYLEHFLLAGSPRTIALPRCRAVHALGELGAYSVLISYFREYDVPRDAVVLFAEDAVRSAVARELLRWKSDEVFHVLLNAARQRATGGLILALGEFHRSESVPLLFETLEDDLCREEAKDGLRKVSGISRQYALLSIRGSTDTRLNGPSALRRLRATLQLLGEFGVSPAEWEDIRHFLLEKDADVVIATASLGFSIEPNNNQVQILQALFRIFDHLNWVQEDEVTTLLDTHRDLACKIARTIAEERRTRGEQPNWLASSWRILRHVLGREMERGHYGAA
jgi:hypothetical protein